MKTLAACLRALLAALALAAAPASAHPMPDTIVLLDVEEDGVLAEVHLPLGELEVGFGRPLPAASVRDSAAVREAIAAYLARHLSATAPDGRPWTSTVRSVAYHTEPSLTGTGNVDEAVAQVWLAPPEGASSRWFTLHYDAVVHELLTHKALVSVRRDWASGLTGAEPEFVGRVSWREQSFEIDRTSGSAWAGFAASVALGAHHIAEGTDHLLFLLVLLLPACLVAAGGRWAGVVSVRRGLGRLLRIVTAFTLGHSLTLVVGALGLFRAPSGPVEVLIALSILVSAVHALWPLFPGREAVVAGGFGLVHGLAFASVVSGFGLGAWQTALTIFGFNLGIELMQLFVVGVTMPWLFLLSRTPAYRPVRVLGAVVAGAAALGWIVERALGWPNPVAPLVETVAANGFWLVAGLAVVALAMALWRRPSLVA